LRPGPAGGRAGGKRAMFHDRQDAGRRLADALADYADQQVMVLALPRGGVPVAVEVAARLNAPLDLVMVRKLGAPDRPELAIGAIADGAHPHRVLNNEVVDILRVPDSYIERETAQQLAEIERRRAHYLRGRPREPVAGKTVVIVDDGIATGATIRAAVLSARGAGAGRVIVAAPVAAPDAAAMLRREADAVVIVEEPAWLDGISAFYSDFRQLTDDDVVELLDRAERRRDRAT
jgi:putative phosphoribosyl transferase